MNLRIGSLPQGFAGYLLAGTRLGSISNIPGSMGTLCLGGNFAKFKNQAALPNAAGQVEVPIDMTQIPTYPSSMIQAGQTWHFQYWYRDILGLQTSNFSTAVQVLFE